MAAAVSVAGALNVAEMALVGAGADDERGMVESPCAETRASKEVECMSDIDSEQVLLRS